MRRIHKLMHRKIRAVQALSPSVSSRKHDVTRTGRLDTQSMFSNMSLFSFILFSVAIRAVLKLHLPQIRHKHSNDLLSEDFKCLQLPVGLCDLAPFGNKKTGLFTIT